MMNSPSVLSPYQAYQDYLSEHVISPFYAIRLNGLQQLQLTSVLKRKNPYLFKAKNIEVAGDFVKSIVDAFLSSQEETIFGNLLEGFSIYIAATLYDGFKSELKSVDLEFVRNDTYYIVGIKSGTSWGNADQISKMKDNFKIAREILAKRGIVQNIVAVNGCMYGKDRNPLKTNVTDPDKTYYKYAGQDFWAFLSGDDNLYQEIVVPIEREAQQKDTEFKKAYAAKINEMTAELIRDFTVGGQLDWPKLIAYVSGRDASAPTLF